jgi:hypothetical protein
MPISCRLRRLNARRAVYAAFGVAVALTFVGVLIMGGFGTW